MDRNDLAQEVSQRTGIPQAQADKAVEVVVQEVAKHLPAPIGNHLQSFLGEGAGGSSGPSLGDVASKIGNLL